MGMGLKDRNNPLGQNVPSDKVGATNRYFKHEQSAQLVESIRKRADRLSKKRKNAKKPLL